jgi:uncharacterized protein YkwD
MRKLLCVNRSELAVTDSRKFILTSIHASVRILPISIALLFAGCGGGGGGASSAGVIAPTPPVAPTAPVITPGDTQTTVPSLTYASASQEYAFVSAVNEFRQKLGLGLLAQNAKLDTASANHLAYLITNDVNNGGTVNFNGYDTATGRSALHIENAALPRFTGVQEMDRAKLAQYDGSYVGEEVTFGGKQGGAVAFATLAQTVYHRAGLMLQNVREIGVAVGSDGSETVVMELGLKSNQSVASDYLGAYPYAGQTGVALHAYVEAPNPFPDLSTANSDFPTKTSYPVSVSVVSGNTITVATFSVTEAGQTTPIDARVMTRANDPNNYLNGNVAFLIGKAPFKAATVYNVKFVGTNNGVAFTKQWSFTTK